MYSNVQIAFLAAFIFCVGYFGLALEASDTFLRLIPEVMQ